MSVRFIAIDPGRKKCGVAVMDETGAVIERVIADAGDTGAVVAGLCGKYKDITAVAMGDGTGADDAAAGIKASCGGMEVVFVKETDTTMLARSLYFEANPARGLMRLVPKGLRVPPSPVDDFAAVAIGRKYLGSRIGGK